MMDPTQDSLFPDTLDAERRRLAVARGEGAVCGACGQFVKEYRRPLYGSQVLALLRLVILWRRDHEYHHVREFAESGAKRGRAGDFAKLEHWKLVEQLSSERGGNTRTSGYWKPTILGQMFADGEQKVPRAVYLYANQVLRWDDEQVDITDVVPETFDYADLWKHYTEPK